MSMRSSLSNYTYRIYMYLVQSNTYLKHGGKGRKDKQYPSATWIMPLETAHIYQFKKKHLQLRHTKQRHTAEAHI